LYFLNDTVQSQQFSSLLAQLHVPGWVPIMVSVLALVTFVAQHRSEC